MKKIGLRIFSLLLASACVFCLIFTIQDVKNILACKAYWEEQGTEASESFVLLENGILQLKDNEQAYEEGVEAYQEGLEEYEEGEKALQAGGAKLAEGQAQYDDGAERLAEGHRQYEEGLAQLEAAKAQLEQGKKDLEEGKARVAAGEAELAANQQAYEEGKAKLAEVEPIYQAAKAADTQYQQTKARYDQAVAEGDLLTQLSLEKQLSYEEMLVNTSLGGYTMEGIIAEYEDGQAQIAKYEAGQAQVEEGKRQIAEGEKKIADGEAQIAEGQRKLDEAKLLLDENDQKLADAGDQLSAGYAQYAEGEAALAEGAEQLADGLARLGEYEGGQKQVAEGLDIVLGTDTYYNKAGEALVTKIADRLDPDFTYWALDEDGNYVMIDNERHLDLAKSMDVVRMGRAFLADTTEVVTAEIIGRIEILAVALIAVLAGLVAACLGLFGLRLGALIPAIISMIAGAAGIALAIVNGLEEPMSALSKTGSASTVVIGTAVLGVMALGLVITAVLTKARKTAATE